MRVRVWMTEEVPRALDSLLRQRGHVVRVGPPDGEREDLVWLDAVTASQPAPEAPGVLRVLWAQAAVDVAVGARVDRVVDARTPDSWPGVLEALEARAPWSLSAARAQQLAREDGLLRWAPDATLVVDAHGVIVRANALAERLFQVPPGQWAGRTVESLMPQRLRAAHPQQRAHYRHHPEVRSIGTARELVAADTSGREFPVEICLTPMESPDGTMTVASIRDVTGRKAMEAAVRAGERALLDAAAMQREILDTLPAHVCLLDGDANMVATNAAWQRFGQQNGYPPGQGEGLGLNYLAVCDAADGPEAAEAHEVARGLRAVLAGEAPTFERVCACPAPDRSRWFRLVVEPTRHRKGAVVTHLDITASQLAQEALQRSRAELQRLVERLPKPVVVLMGNRVVFANAAWGQALRCSASSCLGRPVTELVLPTHRPAMEQMLASGGEGPEDLPFLAGAGPAALMEVHPLVDVEWNAAPARLLVARDVTEQRQMRSQLLMADRMVSVGTLAAGVAHEINNPLAVVTANLSLAQDELTRLKQALLAPPAPADFATVEPVLTALQELDDAAVAAERVRRIVRDLRTMTRSEDEQVGPVQLEHVLNSALTMTQNEIRHRARLQRRFESVPPVVGNDARLGQVFINLLVNAAQAIPEGHAQENEIVVALAMRDGMVVVDVTDTGAGISQEHLPRIFDPFFTTKPVGVGTGLGLAICDGIMRGLGGHISVASTPGRGSCFSVWLKPAPAAPVEAVFPNVISPSTLAPVRGRVLVIDDDPGIIRMMNRFLSREHDVVTLTHAPDAVARLVAGEVFDLVLCDVMMPEMDAREFYAVVKEQSPQHLDRIVFVTGGAFSTAAQAFLASVPNQRLDKPFDRTQLMQVVDDRMRPVRS